MPKRFFPVDKDVAFIWGMSPFLQFLLPVQFAWLYSIYTGLNEYDGHEHTETAQQKRDNLPAEGWRARLEGGLQE
ncbi:MAG: hypothetical protein IJT08_04185 [Alphaproteobacteria bacterium]|nr:hypothetical protein [Alphaproteobacteria bacterium]